MYILIKIYVTFEFYLFIFLLLFFQINYKFIIMNKYQS